VHQGRLDPGDLIQKPLATAQLATTIRMFSTPDLQASRAAHDSNPAAPNISPMIRREAQARSNRLVEHVGADRARGAADAAAACGIENPRLQRSDEQGQQSSHHKSAEQHGPVPGIEAQKPTVTRKAQCGEPQHRDNLCISVRVAVGQLVMRH
jgi:hypothetical protein